MEKHQELEWNEAQNLSISVDLISAAKQHLRFLAAVDRNRWLYEGPALIRAIYRYNACWLPLLAKHSESQLIRGPLVVPLDCEWVWHCHRLSPVRYKSDCLEFYGTILDSHNVVSSIQGTPKTETEAIWNKLYPNEPYELDLTTIVPDDETVSVSGGEKFTKYDLVSAVKRQSPFFYQVSRPHMDHDLFLEGSVARYKGFLHLIKRNKEGSVKRFCVPTYDIDIIWHTHQLNPVSYCKDLVEILGTVLEHDDTDSDRTKGQKLDLGFSETTQQWEETFGLRYWRAGAMYRGSAPSPLTMTPWNPNNDSEKVVVMEEDQKFIQLPVVQVVEVMLEFVHVKNLPEAHKGATLIVSFSKTQPDTIFNVKRTLPILSKSGQKQVASFHCQPNGKLLFELSSNSKRSKPLGSASFSLDEFLSPLSNLSTEKWLELVPASGIVCSNPMFLRVAISFTIPTKATRVLQMIRPRLFLKRSCLFPLCGMTQFGKSRTHVIDEDGNNIVSLQLRGFKKTKGETDAISRKEVVGITKSGETRTLAEFAEKWSLKNSEWSLQFPNITTKDGQFLELIGCRNVKLFRGRKLEYEPKHCEKQIREDDFITAVEFSAEDPYGRAVALLDLKYGTLTVKEEWVVLPVTTLGFLLFTVLRKEGYDGFIADMEVGKKSKVTSGAACGGGCGGGCGGCGGYGVKSGGCGGCGGGCGGCGGGVNNVKSGGCGGCGGGCGGNKVKSGGCGSGCGGCGGGCGNGLGCGNSKGGGDDVPKPVNQVVVA